MSLELTVPIIKEFLPYHPMTRGGLEVWGLTGHHVDCRDVCQAVLLIDGVGSWWLHSGLKVEGRPGHKVHLRWETDSPGELRDPQPLGIPGKLLEVVPWEMNWHILSTFESTMKHWVSTITVVEECGRSCCKNCPRISAHSWTFCPWLPIQIEVEAAMSIQEM